MRGQEQPQPTVIARLCKRAEKQCQGVQLHSDYQRSPALLLGLNSNCSLSVHHCEADHCNLANRKPGGNADLYCATLIAVSAWQQSLPRCTAFLCKLTREQRHSFHDASYKKKNRCQPRPHLLSQVGSSRRCIAVRLCSNLAEQVG